jgi:hypothetical protein
MLVFLTLQLLVLLVPPIALTPFGLPVQIPAPWLAELVVVLLLVESLLVSHRPTQTFLAGNAALLALAGVAAGGWLTTERLWVTSLVLVLTATTIAYALHRYERVTVGLVTGDSA